MAGHLTAAWLTRHERVRLQAMHPIRQDGSLLPVVSGQVTTPGLTGGRAGLPVTALATKGILGKPGGMSGHPRVCPRCGAHFHLPPGQRPVTGITRTAESAAGGRTARLRIDDVLVHQCQQRPTPSPASAPGARPRRRARTHRGPERAVTADLGWRASLRQVTLARARRGYPPSAPSCSQ